VCAAELALVLATRNAHKLAEMRRILGPLAIEVEPMHEGVVLPPEAGESFADNALPKARAAAAALGRPAIADDSGIAAAALGGAPGVRSARYAGERATDEQNLCKLMTEAPAGSELRYVCALAYAEPGSVAGAGRERVFIGECRGRLAAQRRGTRGFGYDPAFIPDELPPGAPPGTTMAELEDRCKDAISHRGAAARALAAWLGTPESV
jgi:XTP/dITP diphosphohydrolase